MTLLLDTHTFLWCDGSPEQLSARALAACEEPTNELYLSVVSAWEIQIKHQMNRLDLAGPLEEMIQGQQDDNDLSILPVELHHVYTFKQLLLHPNDSFDRLLIAQSKATQMQLVRADGQFEPYVVDVMWSPYELVSCDGADRTPVAGV